MKRSALACWLSNLRPNRPNRPRRRPQRTFTGNGCRLEQRLLLASDLSFEDVGSALDEESFWNGPITGIIGETGPFGDTVVSGTFTSGDWQFSNEHSLDFGSWSGWAYSNQTDIATPGFANQHSAFTLTDSDTEAGHGAGGSATYAIGFFDGAEFFAPPRLTRLNHEQPFDSLMVTNTTYTALSMLHGDDFARRFGWMDANNDGDFADSGDFAGDYPDELILHIDGYMGDESIGTVEFHLADYRFEDSADDYVIDDWTMVDVSSLAESDWLEFRMSTTDVGDFGPNTPTYFALDRPDINFETLGVNLDVDSAWIGPDPNGTDADGPFGDTIRIGGFTESGIHFNNIHSLDFGSWAGWSYSNRVDTTTAGFENQHSAIAGTGAGGSSTFAVGYHDTAGFLEAPRLSVLDDRMEIHSLSITNTTYTALSMADGDAFSRRFGYMDANNDGDYDDPGDANGTYPDWLMLTIQGFDADEEPLGSVEVMLADFRAEDSADDYILDDWLDVSLEELGGAKQLQFSISSSDTGDFGVNTPSYFAVDNVRLVAAPAADAPRVVDFQFNAAYSDPPNLEQPQPYSWQSQRSQLDMIDLTFSQPIEWSSANPDTIELTYHGIDVSVDVPTPIRLAPEQLIPQGESTLRIVLADAAQGLDRLTDGVYSLRVDASVAGISGAPLGEDFYIQPDSVNRFYQLAGDWNSDAGTSIFDFNALVYWFGADGDTAPGYVDLNKDDGVSIFDVEPFARSFGTLIQYSAAQRAFLVEQDETFRRRQREAATKSVHANDFDWLDF